MNKKQNAQILDPQRFQVAKTMSTVPGGPANNNPMNANVGPQPSSFSGVNENAHGDIGLPGSEQMGGVFPANPSGQPQGLTWGRMLNGGVPYGGQAQPNSKESDMIEQFHYGKNAQDYGGQVSPMGMIGSAPMGSNPPMQTFNTLDVRGWPSAEDAVGGKSGMNTKTGKR